MRVAVTGASGFIGGRVVTEALQQGHSVLAVSRGKIRPLADLHRTGVEWITTDILGAADSVLDRIAGTDACIHLAWGTLHDFQSMTHVESELPAQFRFARALLARGLPRLVVAGTCLEYGLKSGGLAEDVATDPVTPYGLAKDTLRRSLALLAPSAAATLLWARLFYIYGDCPGRRTLFMQLKEAAEQGAPAFEMSAGEQLRDYLPVEDVALQLLRLAVAPQAHGIYNVCSGQPISVRRLVEQWIDDNGWAIQPRFGVYPYPAYEPLAFWGDNRRISGIMSG